MEDSAFVIIADNDRRNRVYVTGRTLKIHYRHYGIIEKAKGKLIVNAPGEIQLVPFGKKHFIATISIDSIMSITPWHRRGKINIGWTIVGGLAAYGLGTLAGNPITGTGGNEYIGGFLLVGVSIIAMYYVAIALPATLLGEWLFVRSEKKGYRFSIKKVPFKRDV